MINKNYKVSLSGRSGVLYSENNHNVEIESEFLYGEYDMVIYFSLIQSWLSPNEHEIISEEERERIKINIQNELSNLKIDWA